MNSTDRTRLLRLALLKELKACGTHACPEAALINAMYAQVNPPPDKPEILDALEWLETENFIVSLNDSLGGGKRYRITTNGAAAIHA